MLQASVSSFSFLFHEALLAHGQVGGFQKVTLSFKGLDLLQGVQVEVLKR